MDNELQPVSAFQHSSSNSIETQPSETPSPPAMENISLKRRLETNNATPTLPAVPLDGNKNRVSIYKMDCFRFIHAVKTRPAIWQIDNIHYKNILRARKLWEEIQLEFPGISVEELKKRWKYLKDSYRKEMKRCQNAEGNKCTWRYYEPLHFLRQQFNRNPNEIKYKGTETSSQSPTSPASSESVDDDEDEERDIPYNSKGSDQKDDVKTELLEIERKKMQILEEELVKSSQRNNSDNYHFLMSLLPEMDKLGPVQKMRLRTKISQAVLDEVSLSVYENENTLQDFEINSACTLEDQIAAQTLEQEIKEEISNMYD